MQPDAIKEARLRLGLSLSQFALVLGYTGEHARTQALDLETGRRPLRDPQKRLIDAYLAGYRPSDWPGMPLGASRTAQEPT